MKCGPKGEGGRGGGFKRLNPLWERRRLPTPKGGGMVGKNYLKALSVAAEKKKIGATIPNGQKILCLPYAGFFITAPGNLW